MKEWRNEYRQIRQKLLQYEQRDLAKVLPLSKASLLKNQLIQTEKIEEKRAFEQEKEKKDILKQIGTLKRETTQFRELLKSYEKTPQYLQKIQEDSEHLEEQFSQFKNAMRRVFTDLADEEEELSEALTVFEEERLPQYQNQNPAASEGGGIVFNNFVGEGATTAYGSDKENSTPQKNVRTQYPQSPPQGLTSSPLQQTQDEENVEQLEREALHTKQIVAQLDAKIERNGGKNCGWTDDDQREFLRLRTKHRGAITKQAFLNECRAALGFLEEDKVREHITRYSAYVAFEEEKRQQLEHYKQVREQQRHALAQQAFVQEQQEQLVKQKHTADGQGKKKLPLSEEEAAREREERKRQIKEWKLRREVQKEVQLAEQEREGKEEQERRAERLQEEREALRKQVEEFREQRELQRLRELEQQEAQKRIAVVLTSEQRERVREREEQNLQRKIQKVQQQREREKELAQRQLALEEEKKIKYAHLESRVTAQTLAQQAQLKAKSEDKEVQRVSTFGGCTIRTQGRAIPSWRGGVQ